MDINDKIIWDVRYDEEYDGLVSLPIWEVISEAEYCQLSKEVKVKIPSYYGNCNNEIC